MAFVKLLHLAALVAWCGTLLYLPALIAAASADADVGHDTRRDTRHVRLARELFIAVATPAALLAIGSGTALLAGDVVLAPWLVAKLTTVSGLVLCHTACGAQILRVERHLELGEPALRASRPTVAGLAAAALTAATLWIVLARP